MYLSFTTRTENTTQQENKIIATISFIYIYICLCSTWLYFWHTTANKCIMVTQKKKRELFTTQVAACLFAYFCSFNDAIQDNIECYDHYWINDWNVRGLNWRRPFQRICMEDVKKTSQGLGQVSERIFEAGTSQSKGMLFIQPRLSVFWH
jgi:hypothetical protein